MMMMMMMEWKCEFNMIINVVKSLITQLRSHCIYDRDVQKSLSSLDY